VPNSGSNSISVVQASTGDIVATISQDAFKMLDFPQAATFGGERILVTNLNSVTVFKAADLSLIGNLSLGSGNNPVGACSDGINFWVLLDGMSELLRF
jgi:DNA-binding beta-propeller fold protein YncE